MVVIRQAQPQRRNARSLKDAAELHLPIPLTIPLRQDDDGQVLAGIEESSPYRVVFRVWSFYRTREFQNRSVEIVFGSRFVRIKRRAILQRVRHVILQGGVCVAVGMNSEVVQPPIERQGLAIVIPSMKKAFAFFDVLTKHGPHRGAVKGN